jgi:hypothetical protein
VLLNVLLLMLKGLLDRLEVSSSAAASTAAG